MKCKSRGLVEASLMKELLLTVVQFMVRSGFPVAEARSVFEDAICAARGAKGSVAASVRARASYGCDTVAGAVLRAWHRDSRYLDECAMPRPLKLTGRLPSVAALVKAQGRGEDVLAVIGAMRDSGLIKKLKSGQYVPTRQAATIDRLNALSVDHVAKTVIRLVETASRNMRSRKDRPTLIERYAHVPDLCGVHAKEFSEFTRQQGQAYLDAIEDWLEARRISGGRGGEGLNEHNAGVHIFAFLGDPIKKARKPRVIKAAGRRLTKPPPSATA